QARRDRAAAAGGGRGHKRQQRDPVKQRLHAYWDEERAAWLAWHPSNEGCLTAPPGRSGPHGPAHRLPARARAGGLARRLGGRPGWIDAAPGTFTLSHARVSLEVDLSARLLRVHRGARVTRTIRVGIGAPGTTTPIGRFAVTDKLNGANYSPVYGCCILALSA